MSRRKHALAALAAGWSLLGFGAAATPSSAPGHWSFQPLAKPSVPRLQSAGLVRTPVDAFILSSLKRKGLSLCLSPALDRRRLIRRLSFDLIGLPPTLKEVDTFVSDKDPRAYEKLVDRLLASPQYGERWARHWLDVARYADSDGLESDNDRPTAYHYRDFVIRALNDDMPFDRFVRWQLAGDEYEPDNPMAIAATGFIAAGTRAVLGDNLMEEERIRERYNELDDMISTTGVAFMGLTLGCARCHDHKYDPIPTRDYYRMLSAFNSAERREVALLPQKDLPARMEAERKWTEQIDAARKELSAWVNDQKKQLGANGQADKIKNADLRKALTAEQQSHWDALAKRVKELEASRPPEIPTVFGMADFGAQPRENWLLDRGDFHHKKEAVELGFLTSLMHGRPVSAYWEHAKSSASRKDSTFQRRALADWMTDTQLGPGALVARVIVNRLWQGHFGEGLVRTVNDFGKRSDPPSHPDLLEWLASELVRGGWRLKPIHRAILLSAAYRQGSAWDAKAAKIDPENRLLWRQKPRRLEAEAYRDSMLAVAGTLNPRMYGPAFRPPIQPEAMLARNLQDRYPSDAKDTPETRRRSIYLFHKRVVPYPLFQAFDGPEGSASCGRRTVTTVAPQALAVLNEPFIRLRASELARRLATEAGKDARAQVRLAYRLALSREPFESEIKSSVQFLSKRSSVRAERGEKSDAGDLALIDFAQVIFGLNEFIYVD